MRGWLIRHGNPFVGDDTYRGSFWHGVGCLYGREGEETSTLPTEQHVDEFYGYWMGSNKWNLFFFFFSPSCLSVSSRRNYWSQDKKFCSDLMDSSIYNIRCGPILDRERGWNIKREGVLIIRLHVCPAFSLAVLQPSTSHKNKQNNRIVAEIRIFPPAAGKRE